MFNAITLGSITETSDGKAENKESYKTNVSNLCSFTVPKYVVLNRQWRSYYILLRFSNIISCCK